MNLGKTRRVESSMNSDCNAIRYQFKSEKMRGMLRHCESPVGGAVGWRIGFWKRSFFHLIAARPPRQSLAFRRYLVTPPTRGSNPEHTAAAHTLEPELSYTGNVAAFIAIV